MTFNLRTLFRALAVALAGLLVLTGCSSMTVSPDELPTPRGMRTGKTINIEVPTADNLPAEAPVRINGIDSGQVSAIEPGKGFTVVTLLLNETAQVSNEATVELRQDTLLGDMYVAITNPSTADGNWLPAGGTLGVDHAAEPVQIESLMESLSNFLGSGSLVQLGNTFSTMVNQFPEDPRELTGISEVASDTLDTWATRTDELKSMLANLAQMSDTLVEYAPTLQFALSPAGVEQTRGITDFTTLAVILSRVGDALNPMMPLVPVVSSLTRFINVSVKPMLIPNWPDNDISNAQLLADVLQNKVIPSLKNTPGLNIRSLQVSDGVTDQDMTDQMVKVFRQLGWVR